MTKDLTFRRFQPDDLARVSEFRKTFFPYNSSIRCYEPEYYRWKCYDNPVQQGEMWLAEDGDVLVGMKGMIPKRMKILGAEVDGAETGDTFTHPDYQRRGIFTGLFKAACQKRGLDTRVDFIYGVANEQSRPGYEKKLNYAQVPIRLRYWMKPMNMKQLLEVKLHSSLLAALFSPAIEIISTVISRIGTVGDAKSDISISRVSSFPDDIEALWEQVAYKYDVMLTRSKNYLEWRYVKNPDTYSILIATSKEGITLGYMVTKVGLSEKKLPLGFIVDFLTAEDRSDVFRKLVAASLKEFHSKKVSFISTWAVKGGGYEKTLLRLGFLVNPAVKISLICYKNELGNQIINHPYRWHFNQGDSDSI